jgi:hypothetical protein
MTDDSKIKMEDIILTYNDTVNIENMSIDVDRDSYRNNPNYKNSLPVSCKPPSKPHDRGSSMGGDQLTQGNKTERDPTPAPIMQRSSKRGHPAQGTEDSKTIQPVSNQPPTLTKQPGCANCKKLE